MLSAYSGRAFVGSRDTGGLSSEIAIQADLRTPYKLSPISLRGNKYKLQAHGTRTLESEFCMDGQMRMDNLQYKSFILALSCTKE